LTQPTQDLTSLRPNELETRGFNFDITGFVSFPKPRGSAGIMDFSNASPFPEGVISFLDTDLYKLTMQCAVMKYFKDVPVTYSFTNRTHEKKLSREAFEWLEKQVQSMRY